MNTDNLENNYENVPKSNTYSEMENITTENAQNNITIVENHEIKKTDKKITIFNFILIAIIFIGLTIYMFCVDGIENILYVLKNVDYTWVLAGLGCLLILWICDSLTLHIPLKKLYPDQRFSNSIKVTMIGQLFNNITPFSSGGQPMQAYELTKTGKRASDSMSILAMKFIITQIALVIFTLVVVMFQLNFFKELFKDFLWVAVLGILANILLIIVVILAGINKKFITWITTPVIKLLGKLKLLKHPELTIEKLDISITNFNQQFKLMNSQKSVVIKIFVISCIQSLAYYSITYMVYRAFGNSGIEFWQIIPVQAFLLLFMTIIPTPGAGIGAEGGFLILFNSIFKEGTINLSILFWRIYTFYLPIIIGAFFLIPSQKKIVNKD